MTTEPKTMTDMQRAFEEWATSNWDIYSRLECWQAACTYRDAHLLTMLDKPEIPRIMERAYADFYAANPMVADMRAGMRAAAAAIKAELSKGGQP